METDKWMDGGGGGGQPSSKWGEREIGAGWQCFEPIQTDQLLVSCVNSVPLRNQYWNAYYVLVIVYKVHFKSLLKSFDV